MKTLDHRGIVDMVSIRNRKVVGLIPTVGPFLKSAKTQSTGSTQENHLSASQ
ncbi:hypothetical protein DPMN_170008 [Dreissena polymorpha]|uniref:Uncharacterized protein n=1 Tax=Dreissena polymorpha TaxID=45954 RepID=A0A9D4DVF2_DREPO|nr:hypothetical protein DPMN_170008 [Dreissena polymorpha]